MNEIHLRIDGQRIEAKEGMTILEVAKSAGIDDIPTVREFIDNMIQGAEEIFTKGVLAGIREVRGCD